MRCRGTVGIVFGDEICAGRFRPGGQATDASGAACGTLALVTRGSSFMYDPIGFEAGDANLYGRTPR